MTDPTSGDGKRPEPLLASIRALARTALAVLQTRLELLATEFEEERARIAEVLVLAVCVAVCFTFAAFLLVLFVVVVFWDSHRLLVIGILAGGFAAAGGILFAMIRRRADEHPPLFSASINELRKDRDALHEPPR